MRRPAFNQCTKPLMPWRQPGEVDAQELDAERAGQHLRRHGLAGV
jgi:hypothetical protein